ncbi:enoyl-CoA hydratase/isomerase family protein [Streptomyces sp. N50]|uniref:enoyl-CoA hydratase/isomerase family protein n=1 Tax=Streptomyces sp. N50 TaxID=3081765 RepID=UPI002962382A|nr:enoyl-CoA hydratase/isomerase family protein [Streptomyces sp. N50]WOX14717.1 enoyl-CoA hydratase/isomerase family protein [Streptomyces sp. N50]
MPDSTRPSAEEIIRYEKDPRTKIATLTLDRPDALNAPTAAARLRFGDLLHRANVDDEVKVLVIRGIGDDLGSGADITETMEMHAAPTAGPLLSELGLDEEDDVRYPPKGSYRYGGTPSQWYANPGAGCRSLQDFKKISILEVKGYCYGWHFYQAADADLVISSDDALFGHPSFRYVGWAPRMWTWAQTMGLRKFQEMVFTGRPFTALEMYECNFLNSVVPGTSWRRRWTSTRWPAPAPGRPTRCSCRRSSSRSSNSTRASTWAPCSPVSSNRSAGWPGPTATT